MSFDRDDIVGTYMTSEVVTADPQTSVRDVARIMRDVGTGIVPILSGGMLVGVITDRDIIVRAVAEGADVDVATAGDYMTRNPTTVTPDTKVDTALGYMRRDKVRRLPVVADGALVGIISIGDLAVDTGEDQEIGDTLQEISEPSQPTF